MELAVAQALLLDETFVLVPEIIVIFKFLLGEDFKQFPESLVRLTEGLNRGKGSEIVKVVVGVREESDLQRAQREVLCFGRRVFGGTVFIEGTESLENVLVALPVGKKLANVDSDMFQGKRCSLFFSSIFCSICDLSVKLALIFLIDVPFYKPAVQLLQLWS